MGSKNLRIFGIAIFSFGFLIALLLWGAVVWADLEASLFRAGHGANKVIYNLNCPVVVTPDHPGAITMAFNNPTDRQMRESMRAYATYGDRMLITETASILALDPGESKIFEWPVFAEDAAWNSMVLFRVVIARNTPFDSRTATCGIWVMNLPNVSGNQIVTFLILTSALGIAAGIGLMGFYSRPWVGKNLYLLRILVGLVVLVLVGAGVSMFGQWLVGGLLFIFTLMFSMVTMAYFAQH
jgi:hypothetical protein